MLKVKSSSAMKFYHLCPECKKKAEEAGKIVLKEICPKCFKKYWKIVKKAGPKYTKKNGYKRLTDVTAKDKINNTMSKLKEQFIKERTAHMETIDSLKKEQKDIERRIKKHLNHVNDIDVQVEKLDNYLNVGTKKNVKV